nr:ATP synthase F0 subunit 8 [Acantholachesilla sp. AcspLA]
MPQMNPIWWMTLFCMFITIFLITNSMNYFYKNYNFFIKLKKMNKNSKTWKW